jgi:hypothetical protein
MPPFILVVVVALVVGIVLTLEYVFLPGGVLPVAITLTVAVVVVTGALVAMGVAVLERRRQREAQGIELQARILRALRDDPRLGAPPVLPVARVPLRRGGVARIELEGEVPSPEARSVVLEIAEREVRRSGQRYEIADHLHLPDEHQTGRRTAS